jgi:hypothetical protein
LAHAQLGHPAVDADERDGPATPDGVADVVQVDDLHAPLAEPLISRLLSAVLDRLRETLLEADRAA